MDMGAIMKQALEMQKTMKRLEKELDAAVLESDAGPVAVRMNGKFEVIDLTIDPSLLQGADAKKVQAQIKTAVNDAVRKIRRFREDKMKIGRAHV